MKSRNSRGAYVVKNKQQQQQQQKKKTDIFRGEDFDCILRKQKLTVSGRSSSMIINSYNF